jgi:hypothetical protein
MQDSDKLDYGANKDSHRDYGDDDRGSRYVWGFLFESAANLRWSCVEQGNEGHLQGPTSILEGQSEDELVLL